MAMSTMTEPAFMALTVSAVMSFGAAAPGISTDAITRSARRHSVSMASLVENTVRTLAPSWVAIRRSTSGLRSITVTVAPMPALISAAWLPATPPPRITTSAGGTPGTRADMRRHATRDLRHRRQQRKRALGRRHCLVGDGDDAGRHEVGGLLRVGRQMQIGEEHLPGSELLALRRERLLDLHDQVAARIDLIGVGHDFGPDRAVIGIVETGSQPGALFDEDLMTVPG